MGRKAKLKQIRQQQRKNPTPDLKNSQNQDSKPADFVDHLKQQGYDLKNSDRCPEIPEKTVKPKL